jgi:hypothetical protein
MKVYVTKYALTSNVFTVEGSLAGDEGKYFAEEKSRGGGLFLTVGKDCFMSRAEAVLRVDDMRVRKIASLRKQISRLEKLIPESLMPNEAL